ncbi:oxygenase MpaB family protein [Actinoplanes sp. NPDC051851]|uniref:oxygenase MpaB family protein n=1 Tax=Actinoplanes sp. NPDC051851 TaxID=3154753 RepID=UPI003420FCF0
MRRSQDRSRRIATLDPETDHREITSLFYLDFATIMLLQAVTGNLMTFAVPRMSRILSATGQFERHAAKRFVDTSLLTGAVLEHGLQPGPGRDAARHVNAMHRKYPIHPDDFIAVGCDAPLMSLEIADRFGWREVSAIEREALRIHYSAEARAFGSHRPLPGTLPEMRAFREEYLQEQIAYEPQNRRLADGFMTYVATLVPRPLRPPATSVLLAQVEPRVLEGCGYPVPSGSRKRISDGLMRAIGRLGPAPDPVPGKPSPVDRIVASVYPHGWTLNDLGPVPGERHRC